MTLRKNRGFSVLEMMFALAIGLIMTGVALMALMPLFKQNHVGAAYDTTLSVIRTYRNQSITQSKRYIIEFTAPGTITVQYWGVGVPVSPAPVTVATYTLPNDIQFAVQAGFPATAPDGFGSEGTQLTSTRAWAWAARTTSCSCLTVPRRTGWEITTAASYI